MLKWIRRAGIITPARIRLYGNVHDDANFAEFWDYDTCLAHAKSMYERHALADDIDGFVDWERECQLLLAKAMGMQDYNVSTFFSRLKQNRQDQQKNVLESEEEQSHFLRLVKERFERRTPLDYVLGTSEFYSHTFQVNENVLIPRPDSERLVDTAVEIMKREFENKERDFSVLDIGTGSACLILSFLYEIRKDLSKLRVRGVGIDKSKDALDVAQRNAMRIFPETEHCHDRPLLLNEDITNPSESLLKQAPFDIVISNPPYIRSQEISNLDKEVRCHEPFMALDGGTDGLDFYRVITALCSSAKDPLLHAGGYLMFEVGYDQSKNVQEIIRCTGYFIVEDIVKDYNGIDRVVVARRL